ncbi:MAG: hypothetical protein R3C14_32215 [Caldilineaceae bacterium]
MVNQFRFSLVRFSLGTRPTHPADGASSKEPARRWQRRWLLLILFCLLLTPQAARAQAAPSAETGSLADYWFDMGLNPELVDWFNQHARPTDIARVDHPSLVDLLDRVTVGQKLIVFKTVPDVETLMPRFARKVDIIGYNLEHGPSNRPDEINDPVGSVKRVRQLADQYGKELALGPDHQFVLNDGVAMAPYVDYFIMQVQRVQTEPETVRDFVIPMALALRRANPKIKISVQVRTEGDVAALVNLLYSMKDQLDGISILTSNETVDVAESLGAALRQPFEVTPLSTATPVATPAPGSKSSSPGMCGGAFLLWSMAGALLLTARNRRG